MSHAHPLRILYNGFDGAGGKIEYVVKRNQGPKTSQDAPILKAEECEKERRAQDNPHSAPAVERMEQAHHAFFVRERTSLDDWTAEDFYQTTSYGIDANADEDTDERVGKKSRKE